MENKNPTGIVAKNPMNSNTFTVCCGECGKMLSVDVKSLEEANDMLKKHYKDEHGDQASTYDHGKGKPTEASKEAIVESMNYPGMYMVYCPECHQLLWDKASSTDEARGILNGHMKAVHDPAPLNGLRTPPSISTEKYDMVDHPEHYTKGSLECIDWIRIFLTEEEYHGYLKATILKYLWRHEDKGQPVQDLEKLRKYAEFLIDQFEREETERDILEENERAGKWAVTKKTRRIMREETERDILEENKRAGKWVETRRIMRGEAMSPVVKFIDEKLAELEAKEAD